MKRTVISRHFVIFCICFLSVLLGLSVDSARAVTRSKQTKTTVSKPVAATVATKPVVAAKKPAVKSPVKKTTTKKKRRRRYYSPWDEPTYADSTAGDNVDGEDLPVRRAAVEALGRYNGSVVVVDPDNGRVLTMVNQRLALGSGFQPCSTIKVPVAMAALSEGLIDRSFKMRLYGRRKMDLTEALAKSNNPYFANLGVQLGYERVAYYAHLFGLGEKAGLDIDGEHPGYFPKEPPKNGGMGMLTSFGEEISLTPLQLAAFMATIANGGTLYYMQYPKTPAEVEAFVPRIKRRLDIEKLIPEVRPGMSGAVQYGTARRIQAITDDPIFGKTGTCSEGRTHLGWFGSFNELGSRRLAVAVLLTGGRPSVGPTAAGIAGDFYKRLSENNYFAANHDASAPAQAATAAGAQ